MRVIARRTYDLATYARRALLIVAGVWLASTTSFVSAAQDGEEAADRELEEVVVSARKREERLQNLPGSAAALTADCIEDIGGISNLRDLTDQIAGITITEGQLPEVTEPSIRGAGQARNRMSVSATGIYRNGAYIAGKGIGGRNFTRMDSFDLEQVEVYRGPQGAMYGRNALGGAIHLITKRPTDEFTADVGLTMGNNERVQYEGIVNIPVNDIFATRFSYVNDDYDDGFYKDVNGDPVDVDSYEQARASFRFHPGNWNVNYVYDHMDSENTPVINVNVAQAVRDANNNDPYQTLINSVHEGFHKIDNHSLQVEYQLPSGKLSWVSNVRTREQGWDQDPDHDDGTVALASRSNLNMNRTDEDLTYHQLLYIPDANDRFSWLVGADNYTSDTTESVIVYFPHISASTLNQFNDPTGLVYDAYIDIEQDSWSVFGQFEYYVPGMPLSLSAEIRYAADDVSGNVAIYQPYQGCAKTLGQTPCTSVVGGDDYKNVPWAVTATWEFEQLPEMLSSALVYAKAGSSYRHGGLNLSAGLPSDAFAVKPTYLEEESLTYEIGFKSRWFHNQMSLNVALFQTEYKDFLNTTTNGCPDLCPYLDPDTFQPLGYNPDGSRIEVNPTGQDGLASGTSFFIDNIGDVDAWGYEIELQSKTYLGSGELRNTIGFSRQLGSIESIRSDVSPANLGVLGASLNHLRPKQWKVSSRYNVPLPIGNGINFVAVASWISERGGNQELPPAGGGPAVELDNFERINARLGLAAKRWSFFVEGSNINDELYLLNNTSAGLTRVSDPAYYSATLTWRFN